MGRAVLKKSLRKNATPRRAPLEPRRLRTPRTLHDLAPDPNNRRVHPARNVQLIRAALESVGAARSIVIDERNEVLAGSGVLQAATAAGLKLQIVDTDGDTLVAVRRRGLNKKQKRALALYDNRAGELSEWDQVGLAQDVAAGVDLGPFFTDDELRALLPAADDATHDVNFKAVDKTVATEHTCPKCGYEWSGKG
jgi:hypothetical protein